ncbi:MAG TPA: bifunctional diaminohydroxyphosphoribosylaminopyrimidine deaminase/5-amino-6-(5-phosphoribosylamino)uracil reductase RibD, partial [Betaproteobacteria bacterium]|nr:bifunctional diaminohydroxyphosphoribosylaminopyrimidine deaminase/5-amino-6-(5-phosphoribosylamino)uracil reductase RibD [Betaproteobacteria bacterium]
MAHALRLAAHGLFTTTPNPRVGCVIVRDGRVVGEGWHQRAGEAHAEIHALNQAGVLARGAAAYVTLEPCSHHGRTPPCADALVAAGVARVVVAVEDPDPRVVGGGLARLKAAGVSVETGLLADAAREMNVGFFTRMTRETPWVRVKIAASLDGKTALNNGVSQWITGSDARRDAHRLRARSCAMLTGSGTVRADDPQLTVRAVETERQPLRVVLDSRLCIAPQAKILAGGDTLVATCSEAAGKIDALRQTGAEVIVLPAEDGRPSLRALLRELGRREINEVTVEAGARLNGALFAADLVDELVVYCAPVVLGDAARGMFALPELTDMAGARPLRIIDHRQVGDDFRWV